MKILFRDSCFFPNYLPSLCCSASQSTIWAHYKAKQLESCAIISGNKEKKGKSKQKIAIYEFTRRKNNSSKRISFMYNHSTHLLQEKVRNDG